MHNFISLLNKYTVTIPKIQRDYAQGRKSAKVIRNKFLDKIETAILSKSPIKLHLDFIYGYVVNMEFIPLDGQQRLTTMFLLHWFAANELPIIEDHKSPKDSILLKFTYDTRLSSSRFCQQLVQNRIKKKEGEDLSTTIKNQFWFMRVWENDPTVKAMLVMIDAINEKFRNTENLVQKLELREITFKLIDIKSDEFKLTDELYIKMNSRGRPLTDFENFKAEFSEILKDDENEYHLERIVCDFEGSIKKLTFQEYFSLRMDGVWTDLFWRKEYRTGNKIDNALYNYFNNLSEILFYADSELTSEENDKEDYIFSIEVLKKIYSNEGNVRLLFHSLDHHSSLENIKEYYADLLTIKISDDKIRIFETESTDLFQKIIDKTANNLERILFYSLELYNLKINVRDLDKEKKYTRIIRNVFLNVRQVDTRNRIAITSDLRINRMNFYNKFIEKFVENILFSNSVEKAIALDYDAKYINRYIRIEAQKSDLATENKNWNLILDLENHIYLQGNLEALNLTEDNILNKHKLITNVWKGDIISKKYSSLISRSMLTQGDFSIVSHENSKLGDICFFGVPDYWQRILAPINKKERENNISIIDKFSNSFAEAKATNIEAILHSFCENFISKVEDEEIPKDWKYYFVKYPSILSSDLNLFSWKEYGFSINTVGSASSQPLSAYHYNPYLQIISSNINDDNVKIQIERFSELSWLNIQNKLYIVLQDTKWIVGSVKEFPITKNIFNQIEGEYNTEQNHIAINFDVKKDRITEGINLVKLLQKKLEIS